jgi:hypothetical protein
MRAPGPARRSRRTWQQAGSAAGQERPRALDAKRVEAAGTTSVRKRRERPGLTEKYVQERADQPATVLPGRVEAESTYA